VNAQQRVKESPQDFAARMAAKTQYGESASRNRVYLHPDDWERIVETLRAVQP
jgi:hypothetical protein